MAARPNGPGGAALPPPPQGGGILQHTSSFSKKAADGNTTAAAATASQQQQQQQQRPAGGAPANSPGARPGAPQQPQPQPQQPRPGGVSPQAGRGGPAAGAPAGGRPGGPQQGPPGGTAGAPNGYGPGPGKNAPGGAPGGAAGGPGMNRTGSFSGNPYGAPGGNGSMYGMGSMMGMQPNPSGYGSMYGGAGNAAGGPGGQFGSMMGGPMAGGGQNPGSMYGMGGPMAGSMYGYGGPGGTSLYGMGSQFGSQMGGMGSMYGMGGAGGMGSMYGGGMYQPMGSMYGMGGPMGPSSSYNIAQSWGNLSNLNPGTIDNGGSRSDIAGDYGGFASEAGPAYTEKDLYGKIGTFEGAKDVPRSGKRGGNSLYSVDKKHFNAKTIVTSNNQSNTMNIKRKAKDDGKSDAKSSASPGKRDAASKSQAASSSGAGKTSSGGKRAKPPSNFDIHTLLVTDKAAGSKVTTEDPNKVVFSRDGKKKESFDCDEAMTADEIDESVLLSELRGNWFGGHNSALLAVSSKATSAETLDNVVSFLSKCGERLEKNEKDSSVKFDVNITMASLKGAELCRDLLKPAKSHGKTRLGSSPIYGPCLLDLENKTVKTAKDLVATFKAGAKEAGEVDGEITVAFLVLKTIRKSSSATEVHLSSLCIALFRNQYSLLTDIKDKASGSPHKLFRYAVGGTCVCVSLFNFGADDEEALNCLETSRKIREVKNSPPRSGNVKKFIDYTETQLASSKEKLKDATGSAKTQREAQIKRMEKMVNDAQELLSKPETTVPEGYSI